MLRYSDFGFNPRLFGCLLKSDDMTTVNMGEFFGSSTERAKLYGLTNPIMNDFIMLGEE